MTFEEFIIYAKSYNVIPISETILADTLTPVSAYQRIRRIGKNTFLFESVEGGEKLGRYSFIGLNPITLIKSKNKNTTIIESGKYFHSTENFFNIVENIIKKYKQPKIPQLPPFSGGLVGFIGYDSVRFIETIPDKTKNPQDFFDSILGLYTSIIIFDHLKHQIKVIVNVILGKNNDLKTQYDTGQAEVNRLISHLESSIGHQAKFRAQNGNMTIETSLDSFKEMVIKAKKYIYDGDIFQVVLSQRFSTEYDGDVFNAYRALRVINPSPYLYFIDLECVKVIGSSPEILVRMEDDIAEVYPIAGTRARGINVTEDEKLQLDLLSDTKECAEHIMLVDLGRNDLGKVCESVSVEELMTIVKYSHVMHIASKVRGKVLPDKSCVDVFKATFPAGTVSGAPKIRAMEIIDELEKSRRCLYSGGVGYFDFSGNMDFCIAIRTMFAADKNIYLQAGAGIVADSDPDSEYQETLNKSRALIEALRMAEGIVK